MSCLECTIVLSGELGEGLSGAFPGLRLSCEPGRTRLCGTLADQAQLEGLLRQVFNLGLEIVSIVTQPSEPGYA